MEFITLLNSDIPINGSYTQWSQWLSPCSKSCGWGTRYRSRTCTNPPPANKGRDCVGPKKKDVQWCYIRTCSVHGAYSQWSRWSQCSQSCGSGNKSRSRSCTNPRPAYGGRGCSSSGPSVESRTCNIKRCPVHSGYSQWSSWSPCSRSCGSGNQTRHLSCTNPRPARNCSSFGPSVESRTCNIKRCPAFRAVFTNLGASGRNGPTTLGRHYTGQDHDGQVTLSSGIQQWTVPYTGDYKIEAVGAAGGSDGVYPSTRYRGRGARMTGTFSLSKGEIIQILVGQEGGINNYGFGSGGGGATFVVRGRNTPLIIAGGGGGVDTVSSRHAGCDANTSTTGNPGHKSWSGGSNGYGAQTAGGGTLSGGGGGGFYSSGRSGKNFKGTSGNGGEGGKGFLQGGEGGRATENNVDGGFGGGGGGEGTVAGGGGGGYSGGSSGRDLKDSCGGGGGSYNTGRNQQNDCCFNTAGHGHVTITLLLKTELLSTTRYTGN